MDRWACEYPGHQGDRMRVHPTDRFVKRETYMRQDGATRIHERNLFRICRACVALDNGDVEQPSLFPR